jgi:hypothetical protein
MTLNSGKEKWQCLKIQLHAALVINNQGMHHAACWHWQPSRQWVLLPIVDGIVASKRLLQWQQEDPINIRGSSDVSQKNLGSNTVTDSSSFQLLLKYSTWCTLCTYLNIRSIRQVLPTPESPTKIICAAHQLAFEAAGNIKELLGEQNISMHAFNRVSGPSSSDSAIFMLIFGMPCTERASGAL